MKTALGQFEANLERARSLVGLASTLKAKTTPALDVSDILRAALVMGVAALDHYVHEIVRSGMLAIAAGGRSSTPAYLRFNVTLKSVSSFASEPTATQWLEDEIRERHGWLSFQEPAKIAEAIRLVSEADLWAEVGVIVGIAAVDVKARLKLICDRRNKIAHEADMDPTVPAARWPIDAPAVYEALEFLSDIVGGIDATVTRP